MIWFILSLAYFAACVFLYVPWISQYGFIGIANGLFVGLWIIGGSVHEATKTFQLEKNKIENTPVFNTLLLLFGLSGATHILGGFVVGVMCMMNTP